MNNFMLDVMERGNIRVGRGAPLGFDGLVLDQVVRCLLGIHISDLVKVVFILSKCFAQELLLAIFIIWVESLLIAEFVKYRLENELVVLGRLLFLCRLGLNGRGLHLF